MYRNLEAELTRKGMTKGELAKKMKLSASTMSHKLNGKVAFTLPEALRIKKILGVNMTIDELFASLEPQPA